MAGTFSTFGAAVDRCESPIERLFLVGMLFLGEYTFAPWGTAPTIARDATGVELLQQVQVAGHRIDFGLTRPGAPARLAIELDGFVHHGATPEQFERDKVRERALTGLGWTFLRFSGREIRRDPRKCAAEVMLAAARMLVPAVDPAPQAPVVELSWDEQVAALRRAETAAKHRLGLLPRTGSHP